MSKPTTIRLDDVREEIEYIKDMFGLKGTFGEDTIAIKIAIIYTKNVIHNQFGAKLADIFTRVARRQTKDLFQKQPKTIKKGNTEIEPD